MNARRFSYYDQEWEATLKEPDPPNGVGDVQRAWFEFTFRCISDSAQPELRTHLSNADPSAIPLDELTVELESALRMYRMRQRRPRRHK